MSIPLPLSLPLPFLPPSVPEELSDNDNFVDSIDDAGGLGALPCCKHARARNGNMNGPDTLEKDFFENLSFPSEAASYRIVSYRICVQAGFYISCHPNSTRRSTPFWLYPFLARHNKDNIYSLALSDVVAYGELAIKLTLRSDIFIRLATPPDFPPSLHRQ